MVIFFNFSPTSSHLHPLQAENCDSNSRLVVDEDDNGKLRLERVKTYTDPAAQGLAIRNKNPKGTRLYLNRLTDRRGKQPACRPLITVSAC